MSEIVRVGTCVLVLTLFLDLLDLSFSRILWFIRTLRFWLYFILHFGISCLAAYLIHSKVTDWYVLAPLATFLGVGVISNTNIKIAGFSLVPIADIFLDVKAKMAQQAAQDKAVELAKAQLVDRLRILSSPDVERMCTTALTAGGQSPARIHQALVKARTSSKGKDEYYKLALIRLLLKTNQPYAEQEMRATVTPEPPAKAPDTKDDHAAVTHEPPAITPDIKER